MFTLWYTVLSYKEYKSLASDKSSPNLISKPEPTKNAQPSSPVPSQIPQPITKPVSPTPQPAPKAPVVNIPNQPEKNSNFARSPSPQPPKPHTPKSPSFIPQVVPPPRAPSPHPIRNEDQFDDQDDEFDEGEEENSSASDQEDQDSVLVTPAKFQGNHVNDFINKEQRNQ